MAHTKLSVGTPYMRKDSQTTGVVTGILGLAGENVLGSVIISFEESAILEIVSSMLGEPFLEINDDVEDAVGELTNIVVGGAKRLLRDKGFKFELSIPTMLRGENITISLRTKGARVVIPFNLDSGSKFTVEACIEGGR